MQKTSMLLIDSYPLMFQPKLAMLTSVNEAIVIQQLHYWLRQNEGKSDHYKDGRIWCWNTYEDWRKNNFPFWSDSTIKRVFAELERRGLIIKGNYNKLGLDRTGWYTIDYEALDALTRTPSGQNDPIDQVNLTRPSGQNDGTIPETTTETIVYSASPKTLSGEAASGREEKSADTDQPTFTVELDTLDQEPSFIQMTLKKRKEVRFRCPLCDVKNAISEKDEVTPCCGGVLKWKNNPLWDKHQMQQAADAEAKRRRELSKNNLTPGAKYLLTQAIATDPQHKCAYKPGEADRVAAFEEQYGREFIQGVVNEKLTDNIGRGLITTVINALPFAAQGKPKAAPESTEVIDSERYRLDV
jgi:hypothetical protein